MTGSPPQPPGQRHVELGRLSNACTFGKGERPGNIDIFHHEAGRLA